MNRYGMNGSSMYCTCLKMFVIRKLRVFAGLINAFMSLRF